MNEELDVRWEQRFSNYRKALAKLTKAVEIIKEDFNIDDIDDVDELKYEGVIKRFEYTYELSWKVIQDYAKYQGFQDVIRGSRDAFLYGLKNDLLEDEEWMRTIHARNMTTHTYDGDTALKILREILESYYFLFIKLERKMLSLQSSVTESSLL